MAQLMPELVLQAGQKSGPSINQTLMSGAQTYDYLQSIPLLQQQRELALQQQQQGVQAGQFGLEQNQLAAQRQQEEQARSEGLRKANVMLNYARQLKAIPPTQRQTFLSSIDSGILQDLGIDSKQILNFKTDDVSINNTIAQLEAATRGSQPQNLSASQRERQDLMRDLEGAIDQQGNIKPLKELTARQIAAARELNIIARPVGSAVQTIAETGTVEDVAGVEERLTEAKTTGKLNVELDLKPKIAAAVKEAETQAKDRGETLTDLKRAEAALPGLEDVVGQLKELAPIATSTLGGKFFDAAVKETGFGATSGSTAKAKFIAIVNNQVLPLLKQTFGAAFTENDRQSLIQTMGDPDASPAEKLAQLDAFIQGKYRELQTKRIEAGVDGSQGSTPQITIKSVRFK